MDDRALIPRLATCIRIRVTQVFGACISNEWMTGSEMFTRFISRTTSSMGRATSKLRAIMCLAWSDGWLCKANPTPVQSSEQISTSQTCLQPNESPRTAMPPSQVRGGERSVCSVDVQLLTRDRDKEAQARSVGLSRPRSDRVRST